MKSFVNSIQILVNGAHGVVQDPTDALARGGKYCPLFKIRRSVKFVTNSNDGLQPKILNHPQYVNVLHSLATIASSSRKSTMKQTTFEFKDETIQIELGPTILLILTDVVTVSERRNAISVCEEDLSVCSTVLTHSLHALIVCPKLSHLGFLLHGPLNPTQKRLVRPSNDV